MSGGNPLIALLPASSPRVLVLETPDPSDDDDDGGGGGDAPAVSTAGREAGEELPSTSEVAPLPLEPAHSALPASGPAAGPAAGPHLMS